MVRLIGVFHFETQGTVEPHGCLVDGIDVEHGSDGADRVEVLQAGNGEGLTQPAAVEVGMHRDHVDLAERLAHAGWAGPSHPARRARQRPRC